MPQCACACEPAGGFRRILRNTFAFPIERRERLLRVGQILFCGDAKPFCGGGEIFLKNLAFEIEQREIVSGRRAAFFGSGLELPRGFLAVRDHAAALQVKETERGNRLAVAFLRRLPVPAKRDFVVLFDAPAAGVEFAEQRHRFRILFLLGAALRFVEGVDVVAALISAVGKVDVGCGLRRWSRRRRGLLRLVLRFLLRRAAAGGEKHGSEKAEEREPYFHSARSNARRAVACASASIGSPLSQIASSRAMKSAPA